MVRSQNFKLVLVATSVITAGCGGGGSSDSSSSDTPPVTTNPPPASATFPINSNQLVRYQHGDQLRYAGRLKYRGNSSFQPFDYAIEVRDGYSYANDPVEITMQDGSIQETLLYSRLVTAQTGQVVEDINSDVIQFENLPALGTTQVTYYEVPYGASERQCASLVDNSCVGRTELPGDYSVGLTLNQQLVTAAWGWLGNPADLSNTWIPTSDTSLRFEIEAKEVVDTPLGTFEAYKVKYLKNVIPRNILMYSVDATSTNGYLWIHPAVGVIKAEYVLTQDEFDIYEVTYTLTGTNLQY